MQLWSKSPKHSFPNTHPFQTTFFLSLLSSWDGLWWQLETNKRLQSTASAKGRNEDFIITIFGSDWNTFVSHLHIKEVAASFSSTVIITICHTSSAWLKGSAQSTVSRLDQKISMVTGLHVEHPHGEYLQVVNYGIGGHYEPHFDHATSPSSPVFKLKTGNRVATFMIYVSHRVARGFTLFLLFKIIQNSVKLWPWVPINFWPMTNFTIRCEKATETVSL